MNWGDPNIHLPWRPRPGCLEALRAKAEALAGCLTWVFERALWVGLGMVIGALLIGNDLSSNLLAMLGSALGFVADRLPWVVVGAVIGILWAKRRRKVIKRGND